MSETDHEPERRPAGLLDRLELEHENRQLAEKARQLDSLLGAGKDLVSILSLDGVLIHVVEAATSVAGAEEGVLMLLDEQTNELYVKTQKGLGDRHVQTLRLRVNDSLAGKVLKSGKPLRINKESSVVTGYQVRAAIYVPIRYREETIGVILVDNRQSVQAFSADDEYSLSVLSDYAAIAIKNASLIEDLEKRTRLLTGLNTQGRSALSTLSLDRVLNQIAESALDVLEADVAVLYEYDRAEGNIIVPPVIQGKALDPEILRDIGKVVPHKQSVVFRIIARRRSFYAADASVDWTREGLIDLRAEWGEGDFIRRAGIASSAGVILATEGESVGVMFVSYCTPRLFTDQDTEIIEMFASQAAVAIQNARLFSLEEEQLKLLGRMAGRGQTAGA